MVAKKLKSDGYLPIIVPDIDDALLNPKEHFDGQYFLPEAAFNLELRMALYESVFLHLLVSNGPSVICSYNKNARFIQFIGEGYLVDKVRAEDDCGIPFGANYPFYNDFQKLAWRKHTVENILEEFYLLAPK